MPDDLALLRRAIALAGESRAAGQHPFGAVLADAEGSVLMEAGNGFHPHGDGTAHAERLVATRACIELAPEQRAAATLYSSAEPCAMCAGAIYWAGIGRVVFGLSEKRLKAMIGPHPENLTMDLPCRDVFAAGQRAIRVEGPLLEDEAAVAHHGFW
ncbi:tRNA-specific adenosine deaminase [Falsiroseomonas bella]|uniref:tRNA-specific adenosine deaminase n=1 Tax=Falsiroseomonas bella TaxID=2184016 RepID=A0A317F849_9PROT|nr:nucleoside deaminase [Falsiroseomonas bella]PWS34925.1 tRNA-specific adenosine deaminase [Falsiroseomonas bella]